MSEVRKHAERSVLDYLQSVELAKHLADMRYDEAFRMLRVQLGLPLGGAMDVNFDTGEVVVTQPDPKPEPPPTPPGTLPTIEL